MIPACFRWNEWNEDHIAEHGVYPEEAEFVIASARPPWPRYVGNDKYRVWGQTEAGDYLQVVYLLEELDTAYVIHARPLTDVEKRRMRRQRR